MIRTIQKLIILASVFAITSGHLSPLLANWTASGYFQYQDRELSRQGFTGDEPFLPIRWADVEVLDNNTSAILATGYTDSTGHFSIAVNDNQTRDIVIRVLTDTDYVPISNRITQEWILWSGNPYSLESPVTTNHNPNTDLDIGTIGATSDGPGKPFNIFDVQLDEMGWIKEIAGGNPKNYPIFRARWRDGANIGQAFYDGFGISIGGELPYDDTIIGHEGGHFMNAHWSRDDNPGGSHFLGDNNQDPRLSYGEGIATWYASVTREFFGTNPAPHLYINTTGGPGPGNLSFSYDLEGPSVFSFGPASELSVQAILWDIVDGEDTIDDNPGTDDDPLNLPYFECWEVYTDYLTLSVAAPRTIEDFWDGWFDPSINNGFETEMIAIFLDFQIEYFEDDLEPDNSMAQATPFNFLDDASHHTLYPKDDQDWHQLDIINNASFSLRSTNRLPSTFPIITVFDSDGVTEIGSNRDDTALPVDFDGVGSGPYFAMIEQINIGFQHYTEYGNYDLTYTVTAAPPESAQILLAPAAIIKAVQTGETELDTAIVKNVGGGPLHFSISDKDRFSGDPSDLTWLVEEPSSGTVAPGDSAIVTISFVTAGLTPDSSYDALIVVESNDIVNPVDDIVVRLTTQGPLGIGDGDEDVTSGSLPKAFALAQNYPNPFNPSTSIAFDVPAGHETGVKVELEVFNVRGQKIATLIDEVKTPGSYVVHWDGRDDVGGKAGSGIYIYRIKAGSFTSTKKMVILK